MATPSRIALIVDSCSDVPEQYVERFGAYVVSQSIIYSDGVYFDRKTIQPQEVYDRFSEEIPKTATPSPADVQKIFDQVVADGYTQAVAVSISSGLSATYGLFCNVAENTPGLDCRVVDTLNIGLGSGLVAIAAGYMIEKGRTLEEIEAAMPKVVKSTKVFFVVDTLDYLFKGGRIGKVVYRVGSLLDMRPIISCNEQGIYYTVTNARGRKQSLKKAIKEAVKFASDYSKYRMVVVDGDAVEDAVIVREEMLKHLPNPVEFLGGQISPVLVVHTGPGMIGIGIQGLQEA